MLKGHMNSSLDCAAFDTLCTNSSCVPRCISYQWSLNRVFLVYTGAYSRFHKEAYSSVAATLPPGSRPTAVTEKIGQIWAGMGEDAKQPYREAHLTEREDQKKRREQLLFQSGLVRRLD